MASSKSPASTCKPEKKALKESIQGTNKCPVSAITLAKNQSFLQLVFNASYATFQTSINSESSNKIAPFKAYSKRESMEAPIPVMGVYGVSFSG